MSKATLSLAALAAVATLAMHGPAVAETIYDSIPSPLPPNLPSLGFQATQTAEFGDFITFAPDTARTLDSVTVTMSDWALKSSWDPSGTSTGFYVPLTLNIYNPGSTGIDPTVGALIGTDTINAFIPWRPEAGGGCGTGFSSGGTCYNGLATNVTFDLTGTTVGDSAIVALAFNTESWGADPLGVDGPYDSLNFGLSSEADVSVGTDADPDGVEWNTATQSYLTAGGGTANVFGPNTGWAPDVPAIQVDAPEPATLSLLGVGLFGLMMARRRRRA